MSSFDSRIKDAISKEAVKAVESTKTDVSLNEINDFGNRDSMKEMMGSIAAYNKMLAEKITFINPGLSKLIPFTRENLYLICAYSGSGKSTIAANISYPLWKQGKKTLVIANEESKSDILMRVACLEYNYSFNDFKKGKMPIEMQKQCVLLFPEIAKYVKVMDVNYKDGLTATLEGIIKALEAVKSADFSCVMVDFYQNISRNQNNDKKYTILDTLKVYLQRYIKNSNIPVVLFAQLHSMGKRNNVDLDNRIKDGPTIIEAATVIIEAIPDFELRCTDLIIKKDRFGLSGKKIRVGFDSGKFVEYDEEFKRKISSLKIDDLAENIKLTKTDKNNKKLIEDDDE